MGNERSLGERNGTNLGPPYVTVKLSVKMQDDFHVVVVQREHMWSDALSGHS